MITPTTDMELMQLQYSLKLEKRVAELEAALQPFADAYRAESRADYLKLMQWGHFERAAEVMPAKPKD